ncbi:hypothetical protein PROVRUST_07219 [Providencia rustigianii DSM 4541]|uniref:Uncharacterized protein n=1 Tax=Providencia rustigianii DSM 4541 TaxID=500637 RepID=D1P4R7_9GAMM|nr:hypothetical protein PROVRUST_07219 [Providencia rustigianii DSM 4541]
MCNNKGILLFKTKVSLYCFLLLIIGFLLSNHVCFTENKPDLRDFIDFI